jgi:hypothetical protein
MTFPTSKVPWNKGKLVGQKLPLKLEQIWAIRIRLEIAKNIRELAMFNMAIDCKLRSCDLVKLLVRDIRETVRFWIGRKSSSRRPVSLFSSR